MISLQTEVIQQGMSQFHHLDRFTSTDFIRYSYKDLHCTTAELVYGTTLRLPGEYFDDSLSIFAHPSNYIGKLKSIMYHLKPIPLDLQPTDRHTYISKNLFNYILMFLYDMMLFTSH